MAGKQVSLSRPLIHQVKFNKFGLVERLEISVSIRVTLSAPQTYLDSAPRDSIYASSSVHP